MYRPRERGGPPAPVNVGDIQDVKIECIQGFVVFVPGTNPGDEVKVRITAVRQRFATAEVVTE
ncbi:MAG: hypothetical protein AVW05_02445 [Hadesarchaea archaeon DG-33]|nr:MAG: hypothetical protein AVW05_02445 [Hadesarchaea archaeon DG-33]